MCKALRRCHWLGSNEGLARFRRSHYAKFGRHSPTRPGWHEQHLTRGRPNGRLLLPILLSRFAEIKLTENHAERPEANENEEDDAERKTHRWDKFADHQAKLRDDDNDAEKSNAGPTK